jgi:hypothetical protein
MEKINKLEWILGVVAVVLLVAFVVALANPREVIKEVPKEIIKEVPVEVIKEVSVDKIVYVDANKDQNELWKNLSLVELKTSHFRKDVFNYLKEEFNLSIEEKKDVDINFDSLDWDVEASESDREDGDAVLSSEFRVDYFENGHHSEKGHKHLDVECYISDNEIDYCELA